MAAERGFTWAPCRDGARRVAGSGMRLGAGPAVDSEDVIQENGYRVGSVKRNKGDNF